MNLAPGKSDLRFKWIFILKHRCYLEIISADGSYAFNKWPWWKLLSRGRWVSPAGLLPLGLSQLHLPDSSLNPSILSLLREKCPAVSVPHLDFLHHWPIIPYVYYKIIFVNSQLALDVLILQRVSWSLVSCSEMTTYTYLGKWLFFAVSSRAPFTTYPASY